MIDINQSDATWLPELSQGGSIFGFFLFAKYPVEDSLRKAKTHKFF